MPDPIEPNGDEPLAEGDPLVELDPASGEPGSREPASYRGSGGSALEGEEQLSQEEEFQFGPEDSVEPDDYLIDDDPLVELDPASGEPGSREPASYRGSGGSALEGEEEFSQEEEFQFGPEDPVDSGVEKGGQVAQKVAASTGSGASKAGWYVAAALLVGIGVAFWAFSGGDEESTECIVGTWTASSADAGALYAWEQMGKPPLDNMENLGPLNIQSDFSSGSVEATFDGDGSVEYVFDGWTYGITHRLGSEGGLIDLMVDQSITSDGKARGEWSTEAGILDLSVGNFDTTVTQLSTSDASDQSFDLPPSAARQYVIPAAPQRFVCSGDQLRIEWENETAVGWTRSG